MFNLIPAGYRFTFNSWENDGDNKRTIVMEGVSEKEAHLFANLAKLIKLRGTGLENAYDPDKKAKQKAYEKLFPLFEAHREVFDDDDFELFVGNVGQMVDYISEYMLGYSDEEYWLRVLESYKIEYIPQEIKIDDVTDKF